MPGCPVESLVFIQEAGHRQGIVSLTNKWLKTRSDQTLSWPENPSWVKKEELEPPRLKSWEGWSASCRPPSAKGQGWGHAREQGQLSCPHHPLPRYPAPRANPAWQVGPWSRILVPFPQHPGSGSPAKATGGQQPFPHCRARRHSPPPRATLGPGLSEARGARGMLPHG